MTVYYIGKITKNVYHFHDLYQAALNLITHQGNIEGIFETKTSCDCEYWVKTTEHGPK